MSDFDTNGLLHWIATGGGQRAWSNPHTQGLVKVTASGVCNGSGHATFGEQHFVNREASATSFYSTNVPNSWVMVDLGAANAVRPSRYTLRNRGDGDYCHLRHWRLEGSEDGQQWTALRSHANDSALTGVNGTASWAVEGAARTFRYLRVLMTGKCSSNCDNLVVNGLEVYGVVEQQ